jgi:hypothetical protein
MTFGAAASLLILLLGCAACSQLGGASTQKQSISRCSDELEAIPGLEPLLRQTVRERNIGASFEGLELALTINGAFTAVLGPEEAEDDWCYTDRPADELDRLITALKQHKMPPTVSFVAGRGLDANLMERWLESGNLIGSLTFDRLKSRRYSAAEFIDDISRNTEALGPLWNKDQQSPRYFRYPRLKASSDREARQQISSYLRENRFIEAPGTIDARDWKFAQIYCAAQARGDSVCANYAKQCFFTLLLDTTLKAREAARSESGRDCKQILMLEATRFTSEHLSEIIAWYTRLGARFIALDQALSDPLYAGVEADGEPRAIAVFKRVKELQADDGEER